ncbi:MAG: potassium-transporting ATPase subunit KdpC [Bacteroidota bacterium]|nr:potassium-transporting ATPase subunit KdpC [Bacteroidota bacterium]
MKSWLISIRIFLIMTILTGCLYPLLVTGIASVLFAQESKGSLIKEDGIVKGSSLIGQKFSGEEYFWPRPSATDYSTSPAGGSNFALTSKILSDSVIFRGERFRRVNRLPARLPVPSEMLFASGSGLDPHISLYSALIQFNRVCDKRHFSIRQRQILLEKISDLNEPPQFFLFGEPRINVLLLNLELNKIR